MTRERIENGEWEGIELKMEIFLFPKDNGFSSATTSILQIELLFPMVVSDKDRQGKGEWEGIPMEIVFPQG